MFRSKVVLFFGGLLWLLGIGMEANAWGKTGHRVVGEVAQRHLTKKAKKALKELLGDLTLAEVSNHMDDLKSDSAFDHTHVWHYANIDSGMTYATMTKNPEGDVVTAIEAQKAIIRSATSTQAEKAQAVKFLVHLMGDLHQPFHAGRATDWGGNKVKVKWFGSYSNIHRVWDSDMIDSYQMSYTEIANEIDHASKDQIERWQKASTLDVLTESHLIAEGLYQDVSEKLGYSYMYVHFGTAKRRLLIGGIRLAGVLNELLG